MNILGLECSSSMASLALYKEGQLSSQKKWNLERSLVQQIMHELTAIGSKEKIDLLSQVEVLEIIRDCAFP